MSGWIKMGVGLRRHPKVVRMASALKADKLRVVGALHAVWCVFDEHSDDGHLECYTLDAMDSEIGWKGFSAAMQSVGWLIETPDGVDAPDYEEHNGASAKRRVMEASRKGKARKASASHAYIRPPPDGTESGQTSAPHADKVRNREEKRREDKKNTLSSQQMLAPPAVPPAAPISPDPFVGDGNLKALNCRSIVPLAASWELPEEWGVDAEALGWQPAEVLKESERFRQYWVAGKGVGKRRSVKGWRQSWSNWLAKAERFAR